MKWMLLGALGVIPLVGAACSSSGSGGTHGSGGIGGKGDGGPVSGSGGRGFGGTGSGGRGTDCGRFAFVASGVSCATAGCTSFACSCPGDFPKSVAKCTNDGCLVSADCTAVCAEDLRAALDCTGTYTVSASGGGGSGSGGGGSGGNGAGGAPPPATCSASDVSVPADSAIELGSAPLSYPKLLGDENGALYLTSTVAGSAAVDLGGGALPPGGSLLLFKLDAAHKYVWAHRFGSELGIERVSAFSFAKNGDLLMAGFTGRKVDLGGGATPEVTPPQVFAARYTRDGAFVRGWLAPAPANGDVPAPSAVVDTPVGDLLLFGSFTSPWDIAGRTLTPGGEADVFALRFGAAGALADVKQFGRTGNDLIFDAVSAADGSIYVAGFSYVAIDFGKNPIDLGTDQYSSYVVRLDGSLAPVWQMRVGSGAYPRRAFLAGSSGLVVAGDTATGVYYGDKVSGALPSGHAFVLRIDTGDGHLLRGDTYAATGGGLRLSALTAIAGGGVAIGGYVQAPVDFGGGSLKSAVRGSQPFVAQYDGSGKSLSSTLFCSSMLAGGADGAVGGLARDANSTVVVSPYSHDMELGSVRFAKPFGALLIDLPPAP